MNCDNDPNPPSAGYAGCILTVVAFIAMGFVALAIGFFHALHAAVSHP